MMLGAVTYNVLKDWDIETLIQKLEATGFEAVELRTGHQHGVVLWMEVHGQTTKNPPVSAAILREAKHENVGACWNSNPTDVVNGSVKASFDLLRPFLRNCYINELSNQYLSKDPYPYRELFA